MDGQELGALISMGEEYNLNLAEKAEAIESDGDWLSIIPDRPDLQRHSYEKRGLAEGLAESQKRIIAEVSANPSISKSKLSERIGISTTAVDKNLSALKRKGIIKRVGPDRGGHWEIL